MSLRFNRSRRWQLPDGFELHSGDQIELFQDGEWQAGIINLRPRNLYQVWLENGQVLDLCEDLIVRIRNAEYKILHRNHVEM